MNLKDEYNKSFIQELGNKLKSISPSFDVDSFYNAIINKAWEQRELKERMRFITNNINAHLNYFSQNKLNS